MKIQTINEWVSESKDMTITPIKLSTKVNVKSGVVYALDHRLTYGNKQGSFTKEKVVKEFSVFMKSGLYKTIEIGQLKDVVVPLVTLTDKGVEYFKDEKLQSIK